MEPDIQLNTGNIQQKKDKKIESIFWRIVFHFLFLFALVICIGLCLMANDFRILTSYLICLGVAAMGSIIIYGPLRRYLQIPVWRWSRKKQMPEVTNKMKKNHKMYMWLGKTCSLAGTIIIANHVVWQWIFTIRGDYILGTIPDKISLVGVVMFFIGLCFFRISRPTDK